MDQIVLLKIEKHVIATINSSLNINSKDTSFSNTAYHHEHVLLSINAAFTSNQTFAQANGTFDNS